MKLLVVDDHPLILEALREVLKALDERLELLEARSCDEAIEVTRGNLDLALILLDLTLPGRDGFEALRLLREEFPQLPVVVLSATEHAAAVKRALDGGAMGYIPKTASTQALLGALRLVLSGGVYLPPDLLRDERDIAPAAPPAPAHPAELRDPRAIGLTQRQAQVLALLVQGKPNKLICRDLNLAEGTVKIHVTGILKALGVANRTQAVIAVSKLGLRLPRG
ncbi:MAG: response regulator transcription factor [Burkholderiales bacterium]|nr:response regulator transcription factor [Burkholderiales bacterium]